MAAAKLWCSSGRDQGQELSSREAPEKRGEHGPGFNDPFTKATSSAGPEPRLANPSSGGKHAQNSDICGVIPNIHLKNQILCLHW